MATTAPLTTYFSGDAVDVVFLMVCSVLVLMMQPGFAFLEAGVVANLSAINIVFKNVLDMSAVAVCYFFLGFGFQYGSSAGGFIGTSFFALSGLPEADVIFFFFHYTFVSSSTTIVSGAVAERLRFHGYVIFVLGMSTWIYPVLGHWVNNPSGWLSAANENALLGVGVVDGAGGLLVHMVGGMASLVALFWVGYRNQHSSDPSHPPRFEKALGAERKWVVNALPGSDPMLASLGTFLLWLGWYGFNLGSIVSVKQRARFVGRIFVYTTGCAVFSAITSVYLSIVWQHLSSVHSNKKKQSSIRAPFRLRWNLNALLNGMLVGLVASTSGCSVNSMWSAPIVGVGAAALMHISSNAMLHFRLDDPVDAVSVHMIGGIWSFFSVALFANGDLAAQLYGRVLPGGLCWSGSGWLLATHAIALVAFSAWIVAWCALLFGLLYWADRRTRHALFFLRRWDDEEVDFGLQEYASSVRVPSAVGVKPIPSDVFVPIGPNQQARHDFDEDENGEIDEEETDEPPMLPGLSSANSLYTTGRGGDNGYGVEYSDSELPSAAVRRNAASLASGQSKSRLPANRAIIRGTSTFHAISTQRYSSLARVHASESDPSDDADAVALSDLHSSFARSSVLL